MRLARSAQAATYSTSLVHNISFAQLLNRTFSSRTLQRVTPTLLTNKNQHARASNLSVIAMSSTASAPAAPVLETVFVRKQFGGSNKRFKFLSSMLGCPTTFTVFFPPAAEAGAAVPVLFFLSGLECSDTNFIEKAGGF